MNNKAIIQFGFRRIWKIMQISEGVIHFGLDLQNSSYPTKAEFNNCGAIAQYPGPAIHYMFRCALKNEVSDNI